MSVHEQVQVMGQDLKHHYPPTILAGPRTDQLRTPTGDATAQDQAAIPRAPHHMTPQTEDATCGNLHVPGHVSDYTHRLRQTIRLSRRPKTAAPSRGA